MTDCNENCMYHFLSFFVENVQLEPEECLPQMHVRKKAKSKKGKEWLYLCKAPGYNLSPLKNCFIISHRTIYLHGVH